MNAAPLAWSGEDADLPDRGWDAVLEQAPPPAPAAAVSLLEARLIPECQGQHLSARLLQAARRNVMQMARVREDGLPQDPWLRVHVRLGARIVRVCSPSMTIPGTLEQWREWTGLAFDRSGPLDVPGALVPVQVSVEAIYVEPNVWVHHRLQTIVPASA